MEQIIVGTIVVVVIIALIMGGNTLLNVMAEDSEEHDTPELIQEPPIYGDDKGMNYPQGTHDLAEGDNENE